MHITDWLPTLVNLANGEVSEEIDGFDQWKTLQEQEHSPREEILLNINDVQTKQEALIQGNWKIIKDCKFMESLYALIIDEKYYISVWDG